MTHDELGLLRASLDRCRQNAGFIDHFYDLFIGSSHLQRIATLHDGRHHDVRPELYDRWLDALVRTIADCDPQFSPEVERVCRKMLLPHIAVMKAAY